MADLNTQNNDEDCESELSLSCGSSDFGEDTSDGSPIEEATGAIARAQIHPYQFEPYKSNSDESSPDEDQLEENGNRMTDNSWCNCGNCRVMPSALECLCCCEIELVVHVRNEHPEELTCITDHPGFHPVCENVHVLEVAYLQYRQQYGEPLVDGNERKRYTAYRQFVRWCWHYLGKDVRVVIPSCVVLKIRSAFPDPHQNFTGFREVSHDCTIKSCKKTLYGTLFVRFFILAAKWWWNLYKKFDATFLIHMRDLSNFKNFFYQAINIV